MTVLDLPGRIPLPSKIAVRVLPQVELKKRLGANPDIDEAYERVTGAMQKRAQRPRRRAQHAGDRLAAC